MKQNQGGRRLGNAQPTRAEQRRARREAAKPERPQGTGRSFTMPVWRERLLAAMHRGNTRPPGAPQRARLRAGNPAGHYATPRRIARTRQP